jgi:methionyl-tRNA formyltransferase
MAICDWLTMSAEEIYGRHLALAHIHPLQTSWRGQPLKLLECSIAETQDGVPGTVTFDWKQRQLIVSCKDSSAVKVNRVKLPNKPAISAVDFLNGYLKKLCKNMWRFNDDLKS